MPFGTYTANAFLNWIGGDAFPAAPTNVSVSVHTGDPGPNGTANEVPTSGTGYARATVAAASLFGDPASRAITNLVDIEYPQATAGWGEITHVGLWNGSNFIASDELADLRTITTGTDVSFPAGDLDVSIPS